MTLLFCVSLSPFELFLGICELPVYPLGCCVRDGKLEQGVTTCLLFHLELDAFNLFIVHAIFNVGELLLGAV